MSSTWRFTKDDLRDRPSLIACLFRRWYKRSGAIAPVLWLTLVSAAPAQPPTSSEVIAGLASSREQSRLAAAAALNDLLTECRQESENGSECWLIESSSDVSVITTALKDARVEVRRVAARALQNGDPSVAAQITPALLDVALVETDGETRAYAAIALADLGESARKMAVPRITAMLATGGGRDRSAAAEAMWWIGADAGSVAALVEAVAFPDGEVSRKAGQALEKYGIMNVPVLIDALNERNLQVQYRAHNALIRAGASAVAHLISSLVDGARPGKDRCLGLPGDGHIDPITDVTESDGVFIVDAPGRATEAIRATRTYPGSRDVGSSRATRLGRRIEVIVSLIAGSAGEELASLQSEIEIAAAGVVEALIPCLTDPDGNVRVQAHAALAKVLPYDTDADRSVIAALSLQRAELCRVFLEALLATGRMVPDAVPVLTTLLTHSDAEVRADAARALSRMRHLAAVVMSPR